MTEAPISIVRGGSLSAHQIADETECAVDPGSDARVAAEAGVRALLRGLGEDPDRDGLRETPARVVRAFSEYCAGYAIDPITLLTTTFSEVSGYRSLVILTDIDFVSHCEHHLAPIVGKAHVAYLPTTAVVGISKLARVVDAYARRLQIQERMTAEIAQCIQDGLNPQAVGVVVDAEHGCMTLRGVNKKGPRLRTQEFRGALAEDSGLRQQFLDAIAAPR